MKILTVLRPNVEFKDLDKTGSMHVALSIGKMLKEKGYTSDYVGNCIIEGSKVYSIDKPKIGLREYVNFALDSYRDNNYDVIHFHFYTFTTMISELLTSILPSDKIVITLHVSPAIGMSAYWYQEEIYKLSKLPNVKLVGVGKKAVQDVMDKRFPDFSSTSYIINNGVDDYGIQVLPKSVRNKKVIIVGRCEPSKNILNALKFCVDHDIPCIYVGEKPVYLKSSSLKDYIQEVSELIESSVLIEWYPYLPNKELHKLISKCSALLTLSTIECCCLSVLEAASLGTPVVYLDTMGISDIMSDGVTGILVDPKSIYRKSWVKKQEFIYDSYLKALELDPYTMSEYTRDNFSYESCVDKYIKLYEEVISC